MRKHVKEIIVLNEKEACVCFPDLNGELILLKCSMVMTISFMNGALITLEIVGLMLTSL